VVPLMVPLVLTEATRVDVGKLASWAATMSAGGMCLTGGRAR
jgi:hypothetical protein